ncbi:hypothetical protein [Agrobacterium tumefaciens]|uniref:hypothetical protein n=2 Tax=Agrobacterium tumefaciens TaxID=358 RepID=UPI003BA3D585
MNMLIAIEPQVDADIKKLDLWNADALGILTYILRAASLDFTGGLVGFAKRNPDRGAMALSRLSQLMGQMIKPSLRTGVRILDVDCGLAKKHAAQIPQALVYGHFCEIMPEVRRFGHVVSAFGNKIDISHKDAAFTKFEERDIVASELSTGFTEGDPKIDASLASRIMRAWPNAKETDILTLLDSAFRTYLEITREEEYLPNDQYEVAFGFSREEFAAVKAALSAVGFLCRNLSVAASAEAFKTPKQKNKWYRKAAWWSAPVLFKTWIRAHIEKMTGFEVPVIDRVLEFFVEPMSHSMAVVRSGEGYLTPLFEFQDHYLLSPPAVLLMMCERNLLYMKNKFDRDGFNDIVSQHLEPRLISDAEEVLRRVGGLQMRRNMILANGEIDLLVYCARTNTALQIQAKACIPAQGARMTRQIEDSTLKAVHQLEGVEALTSSERDTIIRNAFGVNVNGVSWSSGVLSRSSFGTSKAWQAIGSRAALNPSILRMLASDDSWKGDLTLIPGLTHTLFDGLTKRTSKGWSKRSLRLSSYTVSLPMLDLDYQKCFDARFEIWK